VADLAEAMVRTFRDPGLRRRQGTEARARVERDFDARAHAARIERLIVAAARREARPLATSEPHAVEERGR
jgi:glycosyltransferase involved in cell wall biosynthesis